MSTTNEDAASIYAAEVVRHTAEPWSYVRWSTTGPSAGDAYGISKHIQREGGSYVQIAQADLDPGKTCCVAVGESQGEAEANAARIVQCVNTCAKFPDPAAALADLRLLIGQARGLIDEGALSQADNLLIAMLGVLDGEEG